MALQLVLVPCYIKCNGLGRERKRKRKITERNIMIMKRGGGREAQRKEHQKGKRRIKVREGGKEDN